MPTLDTKLPAYFGAGGGLFKRSNPHGVGINTATPGVTPNSSPTAHHLFNPHGIVTDSVQRAYGTPTHFLMGTNYHSKFRT